MVNRALSGATAVMLCCLLLAICVVPQSLLAADVPPYMRLSSTDRFMDFDPGNPNDVEFLTHIFLSHGLRLQTHGGKPFDQDTFRQLLEAPFSDRHGTTLLTDVSSSFFLSLLSDPPDSYQPVPGSLARTSEWHAVWLRPDRAPVELDSALPQVISESLPSLASARYGLSDTESDSTVVEELQYQLTQAGYSSDLVESCSPGASELSAIKSWMQKAQKPGKKTSFAQSAETLESYFDSGVSKRWNVFWLQCDSDTRLVKMPDSQEVIEQSAAESQLNEGIAATLMHAPAPGREANEQDSVPGEDTESANNSSNVETAPVENLSIGENLAADSDTTIAPPLQPGNPFNNDSPLPPAEPDTDGNRPPRGLVQVNDDVPAGFEALAGPQFVYVDIYFNGELVGATGIMASADEVSFDNPEEVADMIDDWVISDELVNWLSLPMPGNGHLACYAEDEPSGCGKIDGDPVAIIYNQMLLRVDVFIGESEQTISSRSVQKYLPDPERRNTAIFSVYAQGSDFDGEGTNLDVSARALLGYGRGFVSAGGDYSNQDEATRLRELKLTHYLNDHELTIGTYPFHTGGALTDIDLLGVGFSTSFKTRVDLEHAFSSQLVVYLPSRSLVQIVIDGRVYAGDSYPAGNQALDTSSLPDGTYEVEIRIIDPVTGTSTERRIFTKSTQIPPQGESVVNAVAGHALEPTFDTAFPTVSDVAVGGLSVTRRLTDQSAFRLGLLQVDKHTFAQAQFLYLGSQLSYQSAASIGRDNTFALNTQLSYRWFDSVFALSGAHFQTDVEPDPGTVEAGFFVPDTTQLSLSVNRAFERFSLGARTSISREKGDDSQDVESRQSSIFARAPLFRTPNTRGSVGMRYQHSSIERRVELTVGISFDRDRWRGNGSFGFSDPVDSDLVMQADASVSWQSEKSDNGMISSSAYVTASGSNRSRGARVEFEHPWFRASTATDIATDELGEQRQNTILSMAAHVGVDNRGASMGGSDYSQAGVIIDVSGAPAGAVFDIVVNNIKTSTGSIGKEQFIGLQPFRSYEVKLIPRTILGNGLSGGAYDFTLYPGNVKRIEVQARRQVLLIAELVDENQLPIVNAVAKAEKSTIIIGEDGLLQIEAFEDEVLDIKKSNGARCRATVPATFEDEVLIATDPLPCIAIEDIQ